MQAVLLDGYGMYGIDTCRDDICLFCSGIKQVGAVGVLSGNKPRAFRKLECAGNVLPVGFDDHERAVLHCAFRCVVQDVLAVEIRPGFETPVEAAGDAAIIPDEGKQQGERGIQVAARLDPRDVFAAFLLDVLHDTEHPVVRAIRVVHPVGSMFHAGLTVLRQSGPQLLRHQQRHGNGRAVRRHISACAYKGFETRYPVSEGLLQTPEI